MKHKLTGQSRRGLAPCCDAESNNGNGSRYQRNVTSFRSERNGYLFAHVHCVISTYETSVFCFIHPHILRPNPSDSATVPCGENVWSQQNRPRGLKKVATKLAERASYFMFADVFSAKRSVRGQTAASVRIHSCYRHW